MKHALERTLIVAAFPVLMAGVALPAEYTLGPLEIRAPWTRETPRGVTIGGGYVEIKNNGAMADRLLGGSVGVAKRLEIHTTTIEDGVTKMRLATAGIEIKPGETLK